MLSDFHWLRPEWFFAVPFLIAFLILLARGKLKAGSWHAVIDEALLPFVLSRTPGRGTDHRWWLLGLGGLIAITALAGPAWQRIEQPLFRTDQALVVALDLSRSMDAQDIAPSRIARAKLKILELLKQRSNGRTALVVYSANAFTVTPLTTDSDTVAALVNSLGTDIMPSRGSYPEVAIRKGQQLLEQSNARFGEVLLITDGGSSPAASKSARELKAAGYTLSVLGVGTREGAPIPRVSGGFVTDNRGKIAVPRLESTGLKKLAGAGGGRYAELSADNRDLDLLLSGQTSSGAATRSDESMATDRWIEEGPWLLLLLLPIAAVAFRRGWVLVAVIFLMPFPTPVHAATWADLWQNKDQQAADALKQGKAADAVDLFEDPDWQAVSRYRAGDYEGSAGQFAENSDSRNLYNLGNAMALQGELDSAIDSYEQVLDLDPENDDAKYNLELVKNLKERQDAEHKSEGDEQQSSEKSNADGESDDSESEPNQDGSEGVSDSQSDPKEGASDRGDEEMSEEDMQALQEELQRAAEQAESREQPQQMSQADLAEMRQQQEQDQALEQWLRRVPDDPGGLLRRKFRHQYQRSGKDQDGNTMWPDNEAQPW